MAASYQWMVLPAAAVAVRVAVPVPQMVSPLVVSTAGRAFTVMVCEAVFRQPLAVLLTVTV